jgi:hypothetical protein
VNTTLDNGFNTSANIALYDLSNLLEPKVAVDIMMI